MTDVPHARPSGRWRRPAPWLIASVVLAAAAAPGGLATAHLVRVAPMVGVAHPMTGIANFSVNLTDRPSFAPRYLNATANGSLEVSVHLHNAGATVHTFTVENASQAGTVLNRSWTPANLTSYFATEPPLENVSVAGGGSAWANFSLAASSAFRSLEFVSTVPYQFQAGMWGFLNVTPAGPTLLLTDNTTNSLQFVPSILSAGPTVHGGVTLHVLLTNLGDLGHTFTLASQPNVTLTSLGELAAHHPLTNTSIPAGPPAVWANFTVPGVGVYEFVCTVPGHFAGGMYGFLYVGVPVPPPPPSPSTAIVGVPILVGSVILLGVGIALAAASAYAGRFPRRPDAGPPHA